MALPLDVNYLRKDELIYEANFRGLSANESQTVDELRKCLRPLMRLEKQNESFSYPEYNLVIDDELETIRSKLSELEVPVSVYAANPDKPPHSIRSRLHHYLNRINRIPLATLSAEQKTRRSVLLSYFLGLLDSLDVASLSESVQDVSIHELYNTPPPVINATPAPPVSVMTPSKTPYPVFKWNLKFSGESKGLSLHNFLERVDELKSARGISDDVLFESAIDLFEGKALLWYRSNKHRVSNWESLSRLLRRHFEPPEYKTRLYQDILARTQDQTESFIEYYSCMSSMFRRHGDIPESVQLHIIIGNLAPFYTMNLPTVSSLAELEDECLKLEGKKFKVDNYKPPNRKRNTFVEPDFAFVATSEPSTRGNRRDNSPVRPNFKCFNCLEIGHRFSSCSRPLKRFCYKCGHPEVSTRTCPKCSKNVNPRR